MAEKPTDDTPATGGVPGNKTAPVVDPIGGQTVATRESDTTTANPDTSPDATRPGALVNPEATGDFDADVRGEKRDTTVDPYATRLPRGAQNADIVAAKHQLSEDALQAAGIPSDGDGNEAIDGEEGEGTDEGDGEDVLLEASVTVAGNVATFTFSGGEGPYTLDPGEELDAVNEITSPYEYTYAEAGEFVALIIDFNGAQSDEIDVTVEDEAEAE